MATAEFTTHEISRLLGFVAYVVTKEPEHLERAPVELKSVLYKVLGMCVVDPLTGATTTDRFAVMPSQI